MDQLRLKPRVFTIAFFIAIVARVYVSFFVDGFIITFAAIILALALYFDDEIHPIYLGLIVAVVSPGLRFIIEYFIVSPIDLLDKVYPDVFFYITYGLVFYALRKYLGSMYRQRFYLVAFCSDALANFVELLVRTRVTNLKVEMIEGILVVALGRTAIIMFFIYLAVRYSTMLMREEHESRYQYLMMQSSRFKGEIYFLHKNMNQIEALVNLSHRLKKQLGKEEDSAALLLDLSKGVHEIKKDYIRVIKGLEDIYEENMDLRELSLKDLMRILEVNTKDYLHSKNSNVQCTYVCKTDIVVKDHFYLMSILRNLVNNGIDACGIEGSIEVYAHEYKEMLLIHVTDSGTGISDDDAPYIFNTGYSTKFDEVTGNISRGIGLTLVKEMVEDVFKGDIRFEPRQGGDGTSFTVRLNTEQVKEGSHHEAVHTG